MEKTVSRIEILNSDLIYDQFFYSVMYQHVPVRPLMLVLDREDVQHLVDDEALYRNKRKSQIKSKYHNLKECSSFQSWLPLTNLIENATALLTL
jgi:hypothetical protein